NVKGIRFVSDYNLAALTSFNPLSAAYSNGMMRFVTEEMQWDLDDLIAREKAGSYEQSPAVDSNRLFMDNVSAMESFSKRHEYPTKGELQSEKRYFSGMDKRRHHTVIGLFDERITHHLDAKNYRMVIYLDDLRDCIDGHNETKELLPHFMESGHDPSGEFSKGVIKHIMPNFFNALRLKDLTSTATFLDYILRNRIGNYVIPTEEMNMISGTVLEQMDIIGGSAMAYARTRDNSSLLHKCEKFSKIAEGYKQRFEKIFNRYQAT
ncbi:MAG: hypothetical protein QF915_04465, partial [Candidatus Woesearchaeota archaeon]|nr:hypothetical protein [Candidatus Woesearchaeota archaeon]